MTSFEDRSLVGRSTARKATAVYCAASLTLTGSRTSNTAAAKFQISCVSNTLSREVVFILARADELASVALQRGHFKTTWK
jgi:hypothetical protein